MSKTAKKAGEAAKAVKIDPQIINFMNQLTSLHTQAHSLGLHRTGHALHDAVKAVGFEVEYLITTPKRKK